MMLFRIMWIRFQVIRDYRLRYKERMEFLKSKMLMETKVFKTKTMIMVKDLPKSMINLWELLRLSKIKTTY